MCYRPLGISHGSPADCLPFRLGRVVDLAITRTFVVIRVSQCRPLETVLASPLLLSPNRPLVALHPCMCFVRSASKLGGLSRELLTILSPLEYCFSPELIGTSKHGILLILRP